ncbi:hypothetical protein P8S54_01535 [Thiomicrospira sp. R3]|uniref:hypothetical protein n=1 Tax=Thiomicrospira sp. R3 TaxID=3035472 RepID=UPI00259B8587|nr:hypothetical protein [Thiomicrospira sp. R3]WFE69006.1 hypothetical protein P8S54_01535 [Thiomicrospira sp. R3]
MATKLNVLAFIIMAFGFTGLVQASSISTRVNVFEDKLTQFEKQMNEMRAEHASQKQASERQARSVSELQIQVESIQGQLGNYFYSSPTSPGSSAKYQRFTDRLYYYP